MHSRTIPLLWEIWRRSKGSVAAIIGACLLSWLIAFAQRNDPPGRTPTTYDEMLGLVSFVLLLAMFSYIESTGDRGMGCFPRRLFRLPVSTLQLVAVPVVAGVIGIELLYLLWLGRLSGPEPTNRLFVAVLLGAFMVFYQSVLWTLDRIGPLRLIVLGALGIGFFWVGFLPSMGGAETPAWRTERVIGGVVAALAVVQFLLVWRHIGRIRSGGGSDGFFPGSRFGRFVDLLPRRRSGFASATAAHFWFEWRCSGAGFPALVAGALVLLLNPATILIGGSPVDTVRVLAAALALPVVVAIPAGLAFAKPMFWSEEMALPPFVAVRPLADAELIAIKVKVAAVATLIAWWVVFAFIGAWLSVWASEAGLRLLHDQLRAMDESWWPAIAALVVASAMFVSWRFLVAGLWAGMSGSRALFLSMLTPFCVVIVASAMFDVAELPGWIAADLRRLTPFLWGGVLAVVAKLSLAAQGFRLTSQRQPWRPVVVWAAGVACLIGLGAVVLGKVAGALADGDRDRVWAALILLAMLLMPMARVAWAPWFLGRNRHRR